MGDTAYEGAPKEVRQGMSIQDWLAGGQSQEHSEKPEFEVIEGPTPEGTLVIQGIKSRRLWGISLDNAGSEREEVNVTELEALPHSEQPADS